MFDLIVGDNAEVATFVTLVAAVLDQKNSLSRNFLSGQAPQELGTFSGEHGTHDQFNTSTFYPLRTIIARGSLLVFYCLR